MCLHVTEESFGLKWEGLDWKKSRIHLRRGWSKGKPTAGKNKVSMTQVAMHPVLGEALHRLSSPQQQGAARRTVEIP